MWPEVAKAKSETRRELLLNGEAISKRLESSGGKLDDEIFSLGELNFLQITQTTLTFLDPKIAQLQELTNLVLQRNNLTEVPPAIAQLTKLKLLDLSQNNIAALPKDVCAMPSLQALDVRQNKLEAMPPIMGLINLHELNVISNRLTEFPEGITSLVHLHTVLAGRNNIKSLPEDLDVMPHLKELDVSNNQLQELPLGLTQCGKLRVLDVRGNKFSDHRLAKVANIDQNLAKPIITFLKPLYDKQQASSAGKKKPKGQTQNASGDTEDDEVETITKQIEVLHCAVKDAINLTITITQQVSEVRPYIVCCILRNLDFAKAPLLFKQFISLQTRLHDGLCEKRLAATIATHDMRSVKAPLFYDARDPATTLLQPLGRQKSISAKEFITKLNKEMEEQRKQKKRNSVSGIHKYLDLLKGKSLFPFLLDAEGSVISFPPITNCEATKIGEDTKDILIEVTSSKSIAICRQIMDQLLSETLALAIGSPLQGETPSNGSHLVVEQVRVTDPDGNLKTVYPSRADLVDVPFHVMRE